MQVPHITAAIIQLHSMHFGQYWLHLSHNLTQQVWNRKFETTLLGYVLFVVCSLVPRPHPLTRKKGFGDCSSFIKLIAFRRGILLVPITLQKTPEVVAEYVASESAAGRFICVGSTKSTRTMGIHCSPCKKKNQPSKWRLIVNTICGCNTRNP